jgi:wyosine [tRNA(Phe)-imidazoG37] synthetase (radical SAM superfamily)
LGINNIPSKTCSYSCIYCQLGQTSQKQVEPQVFYSPVAVFQAVKRRLVELRRFNTPIDYITIVAEGEPTLDHNLGNLLDYLRRLRVKTAVLSNASLTWNPRIRQELQRADCVSLKVDSVKPNVWHKINHPHPSLDLESILHGICEFRKNYRGKLTTETVLIHGVNDDPIEISAVAGFLERLRPDVAYLAVPTRPPAVSAVEPANQRVMDLAYHIFTRHEVHTAYLTSYEGNEFFTSGDIPADLLGITSVHPMREEAVAALLERTGGDSGLIARMVTEGQLIETRYRGKRYYRKRPDDP